MTKLTLACPECGQRFVAHHHRTQFCTPAHRDAYNNRLLGEGQRIVAIAKAWRMSRSARDPELKEAHRDAFAQLCRELDALNAADKEAGRLPAVKVYRRRRAAGLFDQHERVTRR